MGIAKFDKSEEQRPGRTAGWPESTARKSGIFEGRKPYRKLVVMIDHDLLEETDKDQSSKPTKEILLRSLLYHNLIDFYRYAKDSPPAGAVRVEVSETYKKEAAYLGYVVSYPKKEGDDYWPVTACIDDKSISYSAAMGNLSMIARDDTTDTTYTGEDAGSRRESDIIALQVADQSLGADVFITERPYLFNGSGITRGRGLTVLRPDDAITCLSLYLRAQQEFIIPTGQEKFTMTFNRGLFYWVGARELLPEGWRWFSACVYHSSGTKNDKLSYLGGATLSRMQRALELRDQVHIAINMATNNDTNDLVMTNLDGALLSLMGALDASARVAHYILGLDSKKAYGSGWQRTQWLKEVKKLDKELEKNVATGTNNYHTLRILSLLRNSIHGEPIHAITKQDSRKTDIIIALPKEEEIEILASMDATGGRDQWGVKQLTANFNEIDPGVLIDKLFVEVAQLLNSIMRLTPVEKLSHIEKADLSPGPRSVDARDSFSEWNRVTIRWQLGL